MLQYVGAIFEIEKNASESKGESQNANDLLVIKKID